MRLGRRTLLGAGIAATMPLGAARAQADNTVRVIEVATLGDHDIE